MEQTAIRCALMRGGTSKGAYFLSDDIPTDIKERDRLLKAVMGSPDKRQIDGIGGAHPLTSKVAIVSPSATDDADVDFLFAQVAVDKDLVDTTPNCGNILAAVGPFAIERGLVKPQGDVTKVVVRTLNTGTLAELIVGTEGGSVSYEGAATIDGVPFGSSPIPISFLDAEGSVCGALLPTGNRVDIVNNKEVTMIDNGMPCVIVSASDFGKTGSETPAELMADASFREKLEGLRLACGPLMKLGDVREKVIPKMVLVSTPVNGGSIGTRSFIPHACHDAIGVFAAVSVATAAILPGSPAFAVTTREPGNSPKLSVEHPTGEFSVQLQLEGDPDNPVVQRAGLLRTARMLFDGHVFVQSSRLSDGVNMFNQSEIEK